MPTAVAPHTLRHARLPRWLLAGGWPEAAGQPALAQLTLRNGRIDAVTPMPAEAAGPAADTDAGVLDLHGAPVLPAFVDAHVHLDKVFTASRIQDVVPGLLGAIEASGRDVLRWTPDDIRSRAARGLQWACDAGTTHVRTHVNWSDIGPLPMAWPVLDALANAWHDRVRLELVSLTKLSSFARIEDARTVAAQVAATGPHALLGGFVHSSNWSVDALHNLLRAALEHDLDVDLHVDEELHPEAQGLLATAQILRETGFAGRVVCGHVCALAAQPEAVALKTLDAVARAPITLVSLPITNLLLQDAVTGRTPRQRGITLVKEARARGIPVLFASDNVQDPFCRVGSFDPVDVMASAVLAAQLDAPFDDWSQSLCRADWLQRTPAATPTLVGARADLLVFAHSDASGWPSRATPRVRLRNGVAVHGGTLTPH